MMGELNYWKDLMTRWGVGWIAKSERNPHGKMANLLAQPLIGPPDKDTVDFLSKKEIFMINKSAVRG
jgi:hypothetical protein